MITFKATVIKPKPLDQDALRKAFLDGLGEFGREIRGEFLKTTETWAHQPDFPQQDAEVPKVKNSVASVEASTDDRIYDWVTLGTNPHIIRPVNASRLAYPGTFRPKTIPGRIQSRPGGKSGAMVYRNEVTHPGVEPRKFDITIRDRMDKLFPQRMKKVERKASMASKHRLT